jgi:hypothetical protein
VSPEKAQTGEGNHTQPRLIPKTTCRKKDAARS